jgi:hypothetical protein
MQGTANATMLLGRVLLSLLFLIGGTTKLLGPAATQGMFIKQGLPMVEAAWVLAVVVELGGGLAMLFGLFARPVGLVLAIWCVAPHSQTGKIRPNRPLTNVARKRFLGKNWVITREGTNAAINPEINDPTKTNGSPSKASARNENQKFCQLK